ncbi:hypothetical protein Q9L42_014445 [Methylomarinum sp. Ch1-1]|uniref:Uncharacterized protein n=1 Tax=Methylomarinum roseum TaxID=3067653 RepID=A0AAU7NSF9_9GAMM|nr:hypothetical protein [Methylomarinum sp. Ch1-1]MDP4520476.1 hypothetical protein [Methylomarinum sp. Ch1-1]
MFETDITETVTVNDGATIVERTKEIEMKEQELSEKLAQAIEVCVQKGEINLNSYTLQSHVEGNDLFKINVGPLSPLEARRLQRDLMSQKTARRIIYTDPDGQSVLMLVSERSFQLLAQLADGEWHQSAALKTIQAETRKPIADLRACGVIIGTKESSYRLFGTVDLYPLGPCLSVPQLGDILPDIGTATKIEHEKARFAIARRVSKVNKTAESLHKIDTLDK